LCAGFPANRLNLESEALETLIQQNRIAPHAPPNNHAGRDHFAALYGWKAFMTCNAPTLRRYRTPRSESCCSCCPDPRLRSPKTDSTPKSFLDYLTRRTQTVAIVAIAIAFSSIAFLGEANATLQGIIAKQSDAQFQRPAQSQFGQPAPHQWRKVQKATISRDSTKDDSQPNPAKFSQVASQDTDQNAKPKAENYFLSEGEQYEQQGRWGEALSLYQRAVKKHPSNARLQQKRNVARLHFDLDRRYHDSGFIETLQKSTGSAALQVYSDVLAKVQSYYVDQPNWQGLTNYGAASLELALYDKDFRNANLRTVDEKKIDDAVKMLRDTLKKFRVASRQDAFVVANSISRAMADRLGVPMQSSVYEFTSGAIVALDPYSSFMTANQYSETMSQIEGNFVGLGVELKTHEKFLEIVDVLEGGSAQLAGLVGGDHITAVDDKPITEVGSEAAADMLRGLEDSFVIVSIERQSGSKHRLRLQRRRVEIQSVQDVAIIDKQNGIGYIRLSNFQKTTPRDFDEALWKLHRDGMQSLIVDVRRNPGGLLTASVDVANRFVSQGVIVSTRGRNPMEDFTHKAKVAGTWRVPLIVLIDENSASASEIFAAAISDNRRGTIIGQQSYGKGSVQGIFPLNVSNGGIRLTTAKFYSPKGVAISSVGVTPHLEVQTVLKPSDIGKNPESDAALKTAIRVATNQLKVNVAGTSK